ncbi:MAG: hypothetical protein A2066_13660 [Bacteroidetes bacterium GWB2_41_8]|nr:MAG: hypothetical protein A2066_13660 [Bacteroidetes bacterium GWB2_41_8]
MKHFIHKILFVLLVLFAGNPIQAQTPALKSLMNEIQTIQKRMVPDKRVAILNVSIKDTLNQVITVEGETNLPEGKEQILQLLKASGIQFTDAIRVFPEPSLGEKTWAIATISVANMRSAPDHAAELVSQALMGTPVKVLEANDGWYRIQTPDQYIGWVDSPGIALKTESELASWKKTRRIVFNRLSGYAVASPAKNAIHVSDLVLGDLFEMVTESKSYFQVKFPDGRIAFVKKEECISFQEWTERKPDVKMIISIARQMLGVPYLWGGTSSKAVDCSGMTKTAHYAQGIILARDASQQARYGEHPDFKDIQNLVAGDLLFFGRSAQRVTHVGICMGEGRYIHASGMVRINSIDPKASDYNLSDRKALVAVSRVLNSLNTDGIVLVKDHPWYN